MHIGTVFPQTELGADRDAIRTYAQTVEELGYHHIIAYDHVLGADPAIHTDWTRGYTVATTFHEPFVLFGYLASLTSMELATGILILPQRQTALVAKQAAQVDILTGGRFRLGVGVGWNAIEYQALGQPFAERGRRIDKQVEILRRLWTETSVSDVVGAENIVGAGIAPPPHQRPIPVWMGADSPRAFRRVGRLADGWYPQMQPGSELDDALRLIAEGAAEVGRDPGSIGMNGRIQYSGSLSWTRAQAASGMSAPGSDPSESNRLDVALAGIEDWRLAGATHVSVNTMGAGYKSLDDHLDTLDRISSELALPRSRPTRPHSNQ
jgi:probable F420-dependent oxidoreductase